MWAKLASNAAPKQAQRGHTTEQQRCDSLIDITTHKVLIRKTRAKRSPFRMHFISGRPTKSRVQQELKQEPTWFALLSIQKYFSFEEGFRTKLGLCYEQDELTQEPVDKDVPRKRNICKHSHCRFLSLSFESFLLSQLEQHVNIFWNRDKALWESRLMAIVK